MEIKIDNAVLCKGDAAAAAGDGVGPDNYFIRLTRGVDTFEYIGAAGIDNEHKGVDRKVMSFSVVRTYTTIANALLGEAAVLALDMEGAVTVDGATRMTKGNVTNLDIRHIGQTLICSYVIEGY
jgi:hypothetical protein